MADYHPLIARAVAGLEKNTGEARRALYERARTALVNQLRGVEPALTESEITRERLALEEAIRKVEAEAARHSRADVPRSGAGAKTVHGEEQAARPQPRPETSGKTGEPTNGELTEMAPPQEPARRRRWFGAPFLGTDEPKEVREATAEPDVQAGKTARPARASELEEDHRESTRMRDLFETRSPRPSHPADEEAIEEGPPRSYVGLGKLAAVLAVIAVVGGLLYWQSSNIAGLFQSISGRSTEQARDATPARPKIADRIGADRPGQQVAPVAQRVVLYEEDPGDAQGKRFVGSAIWRTEMVSPGPGLPQELAVRADVEVPERRITMTWSIRRNTDQALPASHTIEITFNLPADFPAGGIDRVPGILMKQAEQTRGVPLAGLAVKVTSGFFLVGLSAIEHEMQHNMKLLKERSWIDVPIVYNNGRRAIFAMEKGTPGERAFDEAFAAWARSTPR